MAKFVCSVCGYVHEGDAAPDFCPICKSPAEKFTKQEGEMSWAAEHVVGVAQGAPEDIMNDLRMNFERYAFTNRIYDLAKNPWAIFCTEGEVTVSDIKLSTY